MHMKLTNANQISSHQINKSGTGGDEAGIWAGDLVSSYRKYAEQQGWRVSTVSESAADMGGFKTCVLQITGSYVYSKMKYEVSTIGRSSRKV